MTRREAVIRLAFWMGASVAGPRLLAANFGRTPGLPAGFTAYDLALLDEIGDTIIPATNTPGAKSVGIGGFIAMMVNDCYWPAEQQAFRAGLTRIEREYAVRHGKPFVGDDADRRTAYLNELDREQQAYAAKHHRRERLRSAAESDDDFQDTIDRPPPHFFSMLKELTLLGYFTSEVASTQILGYLEVPGRYDGDVPYDPRPVGVSKLL